ncbi:group-specific protein [Oceanobacillus profundus]|uniref:group-specific protein n=1 Tax=Oceanobacillus profundus TaxID=372463 RepID=UPI002042298C|nr:group-specific protein [Oceanobacillus profundus]MCM3396449.1 group-specific protein [Oceanobacillus profundus]
MFQIQVNQEELKQIYLEEIRKRLNKIELETTYWDTKELKRQTNMSWNTMQEKFFNDPDFPKFNTGGKWYFPAKECREFLEQWAKDNQYQSLLSQEINQAI